MRFQVFRSSMRFQHEEPPCPDAVAEVVYGRTEWYIDINTLEELVAFGAEHGNIVVAIGGGESCTDVSRSSGSWIEIYDYYRE